MPSEFEIAAAERAAREVAPGMGGFSARAIARAALEAAERVRNAGVDRTGTVCLCCGADIHPAEAERPPSPAGYGEPRGRA